MLFGMRAFLGLTLAFATTLNALEQATLRQGVRPNIVVILTDDQDLHMDSIDYMPLLKKYIIDHGTFYKRHYCSTAICCPSRVTLWTGRNAHNTNVTDIVPPYGPSYFIFNCGSPANIPEVVIQNLWHRGSMTTGYQSGSKMSDTAHITLESYSMLTQSRIGTPLDRQDGHPRTFFLILIPTPISMRHFKEMTILQ
jgi:hypothetical protein